jgi:hypothetical protein
MTTYAPVLAAAAAALIALPSFAVQIPAACQGDAASLCPGMTPGDHKFGKCVKANESRLSPACKQAAKEMRRERKGEHPREHGGVGQMPGASTTPQPPMTSTR